MQPNQKWQAKASFYSFTLCGFIYVGFLLSQEMESSGDVLDVNSFNWLLEQASVDTPFLIWIKWKLIKNNHNFPF